MPSIYSANRWHISFLLLLFLGVLGCQTLSLYGKTGLIVENQSTFDIRIETLKKIIFTDRTTTPWERSEQYYIHKLDAKPIKAGETKKFSIADGYYGIEICDGRTCSYTNFHFNKVMKLIIENEEDNEGISYRFVE